MTLTVDTSSQDDIKAASDVLRALMADNSNKADDAAREKEQAKRTAASKPKASTSKPKPKKEAETVEDTAPEAPDEDAEKEEKGITRDEVRAALKAYSKVEGQDAAIKILKDHDASSLGELSEDNFQSVYDAAQLEDKDPLD